VPVEKLSISFEPELAQRTRAAAEASGRTLSAFVAEAVEYRLKLDAARRLLEEWEAEHDPIGEQERARVRSRWRD
jgi:predicted transcriptional regulator